MADGRWRLADDRLLMADGRLPMAAILHFLVTGLAILPIISWETCT